MIISNDKTPHRGQPERGISCNFLNPCVVDHCKQPTLKTQPPRMGTALRYFLKQYAADLHPLAESGDKMSSLLIDGCNNLLIESDRLEGGNYER